MDNGVFIGIDHGGTTTTALVLDLERGKLSSHSVPMPKRMPQVGWVEHTPEEFLETSLASAHGALKYAGLSWADVQGIGFANQGETSMAWSSNTGLGVGPALSWEDRRTSDICEKLEADGVDNLVRERTGIMLDPYFSASKFRWLIDNVSSVASACSNGSLRFGGTETYVIDRLTSGDVHATDAGTASRTALFNLRDVKWDSELLNAFGLAENQLPTVRPTCGDYGTARHAGFAGATVPITADAVDAHAALFAQGCTDNTTVKATYGTGAFIEINTGTTPTEPDGNLPVFIAWEMDDQVDYTVEGGVFSVGSAIDWVVRSGLLPSAETSSELAQSTANSGGVVMVPCFTGLSAPYWQSGARASITGLGLDTEPGHIARALLDGIAFQCADIVHALDEKMGGTVLEVRADGGPTNNQYLMQRQADLLGMPISVSLEADMTALGAAYLSAIGAGQLTAEDVSKMDRKAMTYDPAMESSERDRLWDGWHRSVKEVCERAAS
ncbi:MAG: glycerol kinase [Rhodospirillales bacterium]|nr:glycerol kinase [Rhodospirillales bacterium]